MVTECSVPGITTSSPASFEQFHLRTQGFRAGCTATFRVNRHQSRQTGHFVDLLRHGHAFFNVFKLDLTGVFGDDRTSQRIPVGQQSAGFNGRAVFDQQFAPYGNL